MLIAANLLLLLPCVALMRTARVQGQCPRATSLARLKARRWPFVGDRVDYWMDAV